MMPYQSYQIYQAERTKTAAEIRRADEQLGHMAAERVTAMVPRDPADSRAPGYEPTPGLFRPARRAAVRPAA